MFKNSSNNAVFSRMNFYTNFRFSLSIDLYLDQPTLISLSFNRLAALGTLDLSQTGGASMAFGFATRKGDLIDTSLYYLPASGTIAPLDPDGDGVVFESLLPSGDYSFYSLASGEVGGARGLGQLTFQAVPEPSGLLTILVAVFALFGYSRSR